MIEAPKTELILSVDHKGNVRWGNDDMVLYRATVKNDSEVPALFVQLGCDLDPDEVYFKDNYFVLLPKEERAIDILVAPKVKNIFKTTSVSVNAWNAPN
jgi:hypothetical protein